MRRRLGIVALGPLLVCGLAVPALSAGEELDDVRRKIDSKQGELASKQGRARVLTSEIAAFNERIRGLQASISGLAAQEATRQADLDSKQAELAQIQEDLRVSRARLVQLRARLVRARRVLAERLLEIYKSDQPDLMSVVLNADGFADLIESGDFLSRVGRQDRQIILAVRDAKAEATRTTRRLDGLEERQQALTVEVLQERDQVAGVRRELTAERDSFASVRADRRERLGRVQATASAISDDIGTLESQEQKIQAKLAAQQTGVTALPAGPVRGGGTFIWPINGVITSPFCEARSWEACHPGLDIAAPSATPIRAAASGTVTLAGPNGGYGNYTCIQHTGALTSCYAHQLSISVSAGQSVSQGDIIGLVGSTGFSTGPHVHFEARVNGAVADPNAYL